MTYPQLLDHLASGHNTPAHPDGWQASTVWRNHAALHVHYPWPHTHAQEPDMPYAHTGPPIPT